MPRICFETAGIEAGQECLSCEGFGSSKRPGGPRSEILWENVREVSREERPRVSLPGVPRLQPLCGALGRNSRGSGDPGHAQGLPPLPSHCTEPAEMENDIMLLPQRRCPGHGAEGRNEPLANDPGQAEGQVGLIQSAVECDALEAVVEKEEGLTLVPPRRCPDPVDGGRNEPTDSDPEQAEGHVGLLKFAVKQDAPETGVPCTGRFHPLLWVEGIPEGRAPSETWSPTVSPQACDVGREVCVQNSLWQTALSEGEQVLGLNGGGARPASDPTRQHGAGVWSSSPSAERAVLEQQGCEDWFSLSVATWNLAGAGKKKIKGILTTVCEHDLVAVQEYPRQEVGWHVLDHGKFQCSAASRCHDVPSCWDHV